MTTSVTLPKMGESVVEGTIIRWLKQEGEYVKEDEPLVEISTDKIDTEMPAPASGVLTKIVAGPDETIEVGAEIAQIDESAKEGGAPAEDEAKDKKEEPEPKKEQAKKKEEPAAEKPEEPKAEEPKAEEKPTKEEKPAEQPSEKKTAPAARAQETDQGDGAGTALSPLVRKLARERGVDLGSVHGSGPGGRVTKEDVMAASGNGDRGAPAATAPSQPTASRPPATMSQFAVPAGDHEDVPFSRVRRSIAEHMTRSLQTAAQLTNVIEVDMTRVASLRARAKASFEQAEGFSLTFMPFIALAVVEALRVLPEFNAHILEDGTSARLFKQVHIGIAVGRDEGLIVPVVHGADGMNLIGLARAINDVGTRARAKGGLKPDDVVGGTFSITNYGSFGAIIDTPIISQPQVAILGVGAIAKRPHVITLDGSDAIAIRQMMYLSLTYDHRWIDGHKAAQFNGRLRAILEEADFARDLGLEPA